MPFSNRFVVRALLPIALLSALSGSFGCSGKDGDNDGAGAAAGRGGTTSLSLGGSDGLGAVGTGGSAVVGSKGDMCVIEDDGSGCVGEAYEGESIPLDIYIMFDQSGSMCNCVDPVFDMIGRPCPDAECKATRMDAVREAARLFMDDPESRGIGVGLGYFGKQPIGEASCDEADHVDAAVEIGVLPAQAERMMSSLDEIEPTGETPSGAAIRGACQYAQSHKQDNPGHETVILLLTDGRPEAPRTCNDFGTCCPTIEDAVEAATECLEGDPGVKTYVLGVGPMLDNLDGIAAAGGTERAYLVEGGDVANQVLEALRIIRGDAIPCTMALPDAPGGMALAYDEVNITYASPDCEPTYYSYVESVDACDDGGWYYDDATSPQKIHLCPTSCDQVSAPGGKLVFTVGCETRTIPK
ncbi:MAG TPA: vWA domain-containing protein [Reyranella sp.]|nr:vWA domain-containing protein [Reyranella sp.]